MRHLIFLLLLMIPSGLLAQEIEEEEYLFLPENDLHLEDGYNDLNFMEDSAELNCWPKPRPKPPKPKPPCPKPDPDPCPPDDPGQDPPPPCPDPDPPCPKPDPKPDPDPCPKPKPPTCNISEAEFNELLSKMESKYKPIFEGNNFRLRVERKWADPTVNLKTSRVFGYVVVKAYGGLARRCEITRDGFVLAMCHEFGRFLGGFSKNRWGQSVAGQGDYFSTLSCGREMWRNDYDENSAYKYKTPAYIQSLCDEVFHDENSRNLCKRQVMAGKSIADLMAVLENSYVEFDNHDFSEVDKTLDCHPTSQCRMDSYIAGAICKKNWNPLYIPKTELESVNYSCTEYGGYVLGIRPKCWYKPTLPSCNGSGC